MKNIFFLFCLLMPLKDTFGQKYNNHNLSIQPFNLALGTLQGAYEYGLTPNISASISIGQKLASSIIDFSNIEHPNLSLEKFQLKGIKIIPEFRWYLQSSKQRHTKFFIGAYYTYQQYTTPIKGTYTTATTSHKIALDGSILSQAIGLQIGYKQPIAKNFFLDFMIAGPGYSLNQLSISRSTSEINDKFEEIIENSREKNPTINQFINNFTLERLDDNRKATTKFEFPYLRFGLSIGYRF